ncbi:MAG TPA: LacI family DNA-binding transcriptional regulator [Terriglobales bacterium]|jgi:LacI family transcriptional regulator|nr:LacI family DNA-binding transcriptional regulator [Terriglobales bacterium]
MVKTSVITIRDVAKEAGFSSTTVSIVLNNAPLARYIPAATKKRIEKAAKKLGYRPNLFARSLRSKRSHTVGVMVFDMTDPYCTLVLRGIENTLYQSSYLPMLTDVHNERSRFERYLEMLLDRRVEGLIVLANWLFVDVDVLADLEKSSIPSVMIAREIQTDTVSSVIVDNEFGGSAAVEHLYQLGHRKIAFIRGPKTLTDSAPRWRGVRSFAKDSGLELDPRLILDLPESRDPISSFEAGYKLTEELIKSKRPFTALMAFDDMTAFGAIRAMAKAGMRVPEHCSVIGFDDVAACSLYNPPLTTIRQPMQAMGAMAANLVVEGINAVLEKREVSAVHRKMAPELAVRESTRSLL